MTWDKLPTEIQNLMLERQFEQTGKKDAGVFEESIYSGKNNGGFSWLKSIEGSDFWVNILSCGDIDHFYTLYPKEDAAKQLAELQAEFEQYKKESVKWGVNDFLYYDKEGYSITPENAQKALEEMIYYHDATVGINWETLDYWYEKYATPNAKYYALKGTQNFYKQEKDRLIYVGTGVDTNIISIGTGKVPEYYEECTEEEFAAAYQKVKELLNGIEI